MKDMFDNETLVGDIVLLSRMNTTGTISAVVLGIGVNQIKTSYGNKAAGNFAVITQQLEATGRHDIIQKFRTQYADQMDFKITKPKAPVTKWKYAIARKGQFITIGKLACNSQSGQYGSLKTFMKGKDEAIRRHSMYVGRGVTGAGVGGYVNSFKVDPDPYGYNDDAFFKLGEIKELGLAGSIEREITFAEFQAALDASKSADAVAIKASGVWKI